MRAKKLSFGLFFGQMGLELAIFGAKKYAILRILRGPTHWWQNNFDFKDHLALRAQKLVFRVVFGLVCPEMSRES